MNTENTENTEINNQIISLLYNLSEKIILNIEIILFNTLNKMIDGKFVQNTLINLCNLNYNEIYKCMDTKSSNVNKNVNENSNENANANKIINEFLLIQKIFHNDLLSIFKISLGVTIEIIKNLNRTQYDFSSQDKFINSIQNQFELIRNIKFEYFNNLILNHKCSDTK